MNALNFVLSLFATSANMERGFHIRRHLEVKVGRGSKNINKYRTFCGGGVKIIQKLCERHVWKLEEEREGERTIERGKRR